MPTAQLQAEDAGLGPCCGVPMALPVASPCPRWAHREPLPLAAQFPQPSAWGAGGWELPGPWFCTLLGFAVSSSAAGTPKALGTCPACGQCRGPPSAPLLTALHAHLMGVGGACSWAWCEELSAQPDCSSRVDVAAPGNSL